MVLEELCLHGCKELTDYSVEVLVKHQPSLQRVDISACTELTNRSVEAIARGLKSLTHLSLSCDWRITEKGAHSVFVFMCIIDLNELINVKKLKGSDDSSSEWGMGYGEIKNEMLLPIGSMNVLSKKARQ